MTKDELIKTHPLYDKWISEWQFYAHSYSGGKDYHDGDYLKQHPCESDVNYIRRKSLAFFYNYCQPIVDIFVSHLHRPKHTRDFGSLTNRVLFKNFLDDADYDGMSYIEFMKSVDRYASIYGRVTVVVDMPSMEVKTVAEAEAHDIRPYCTIVTPENVLDWSYSRLETGRNTLDMIKIKEDVCGDVTQYRIWTRNEWRLWKVDGEKDPELVDSGIHGLGVVPVVNQYNRRGGKAMLGLSDLQDIAGINKNIYQLCSASTEIVENTAFPMLALPFENGGDDKVEVGAKSVIEFDGEKSQIPYWLEPPHSSLEQIMALISQDMTEIFRISNLGGMINVETSKQPWSGPGQEMQSNRLTAAMTQKADNSEEGELSVLRLWALWMDKEFDGSIEYQHDFAVRDITVALQNSISAQGAQVNSDTFHKENQKRIAGAAIPKMSDALRAIIGEEIDKSEVKDAPTNNPEVDSGINNQGDGES